MPSSEQRTNVTLHKNDEEVERIYMCALCVSRALSRCMPLKLATHPEPFAGFDLVLY